MPTPLTLPRELAIQLFDGKDIALRLPASDNMPLSAGNIVVGPLEEGHYAMSVVLTRIEAYGPPLGVDLRPNDSIPMTQQMFEQFRSTDKVPPFSADFRDVELKPERHTK